MIVKDYNRIDNNEEDDSIIMPLYVHMDAPNGLWKDESERQLYISRQGDNLLNRINACSSRGNYFLQVGAAPFLVPDRWTKVFENKVNYTIPSSVSRVNSELRSFLREITSFD